MIFIYNFGVMSYEIDADHSRTYLLPPAVEDWVEPDHPVRLVRELVEQFMGRYESVSWSEPSGTGRPRYSPQLLLKIWIAAYLFDQTSCRRVEQLCRDYLPFVWLTTGERPDHNTLWRFWKDHQELIGTIFATSVRVAMQMGLVGMAVNAIDGTKIAAAGSTRRVRSAKDLENKLGRLDERIREIEIEIETARQEESTEPLEALGAELGERTKLRERVSKELDVARREGTRVHPGEPEARLMKKVGLGYNAQTGVDAKSGVIVGQSLVNNQSDETQLVPMIEKIAETVGEVAQETLADGGYNTLDAVAAASQKDYPILLSPAPQDPEVNSRNPYHASKFNYDENADVWRCPEGKALTFSGTRGDRRRKGKIVRSYRASGCQHCPVRDRCTSDPYGRTIELREGYLEMRQQRQKRQDPEKRELLRRRAEIAERPFAVIKSILGFRRFKARGLEKAAIEWSFVCAVYNIKVIIKALPELRGPSIA